MSYGHFGIKNSLFLNFSMFFLMFKDVFFNNPHVKDGFYY